MTSTKLRENSIDSLLTEENHKQVQSHISRFEQYTERSRYDLALLEIDLMPSALPKDAFYAKIAVGLSKEKSKSDATPDLNQYFDKVIAYCVKHSKYLK